MKRILSLLALISCLASLAGCTPNAATNSDVDNLRTYSQQRFDELQAQLTVISEQIDTTPAPMTSSTYSETSSSIQYEPTLRPESSPALPADGPMIEITEIENILPASKKQELAELASDLRSGRSSSSRVRVKKTTTSKTRSYSTLAKKHIAVSGLSVRDVQRALKSAGMNPGAIDGRLGPQTIRAIRNFQKAERLKIDGVVGPRTWDRLRKHL